MLTSTGAVVTSQSGNAITGEYRHKQEPSLWVAALLFFLFVVPFILYLMANSRETKHTCSITVMPWAAGSGVTYMADTMIVHNIARIIDQLPT